jgi:hypothetical protein
METRKAADKKTDGDEIEEASQKEPKKKKKKKRGWREGLESTERTHTAWSAILMMEM